METAKLVLLAQLAALQFAAAEEARKAAEAEAQLAALRVYEIAQAGKFLKSMKRAEDNGYQFPNLFGQV